MSHAKKSLFLGMILMSFSIISAHADDQTACKKNVENAVAGQVKIEFPNEPIVVLSPDLGRWDGGEVVSVNVQTASTSDTQDIVKVYTVTIDEVCSVEIR